MPATGLIPPGLLGSARTRESGSFRASSGTRPVVPTETFELDAVVNPIFFNQYAALTAELYSAFKERGVKIRPTNRTWAEFNDARANGKAHIFVGRGVADYPDPDTFAYGILHSKEGTVGRFCGSPELDALILNARAELDPAARAALYREIEEILERDALLMPLFHEQVYRFARPGVEGLEITFSTPPVVAYEKLWAKR
jgi:ABC-type transport system substrate-binding protein